MKKSAALVIAAFLLAASPGCSKSSSEGGSGGSGVAEGPVARWADLEEAAKPLRGAKTGPERLIEASERLTRLSLPSEIAEAVREVGVYPHASLPDELKAAAAAVVEWAEAEGQVPGCGADVTPLKFFRLGQLLVVSATPSGEDRQLRAAFYLARQLVESGADALSVAVGTRLYELALSWSGERGLDKAAVARFAPDPAAGLRAIAAEARCSYRIVEEQLAAGQGAAKTLSAKVLQDQVLILRNWLSHLYFSCSRNAGDLRTLGDHLHAQQKARPDIALIQMMSVESNHPRRIADVLDAFERYGAAPAPRRRDESAPAK